jgi:hypothetical protein
LRQLPPPNFILERRDGPFFRIWGCKRIDRNQVSSISITGSGVIHGAAARDVAVTHAAAVHVARAHLEKYCP